MTQQEPTDPGSAWVGDAVIARRVIDHINAMTGYWTRDLICRFANAAYSDWFGKTKEQMLGIHMPDALGPIFPLNLPHIQAVLAGEQRIFERDVVVADGSLRHSLMTYTPDIVDGAVQGFFVHVADVTPLKSTEQALQQARQDAAQASAERLRELQDAAELLQGLGDAGRDMAETLDFATVCATLLRHAQRLLPLAALGVHWRDHASGILAPLAQWDAAGSPGALAGPPPDSILAWLSGQHEPVMVPGTPLLAAALRHGEGTAGLLLVHLHAVDARALSILRNLAAHASTALSNADAYARLRDAQQELIEQGKMAALVGLVAGVAHELNTPIGNALLTASSLAERIGRCRDACASGRLGRQELQNCLDEASIGLGLIERAAAVAAGLVNNFKQVAADRRADQRCRFDLSVLVEEFFATRRQRADALGVRLVADVPAGMTMESYPAMLAQVLGHLTDNSLQHGLAGRTGGRIRIAARHSTPGHMQLTVEDNGAGMSSYVLAHIFDPFFTTQIATGTGLGMSVCFNQVCTVLGGHIRMSSQLDQGTLAELDLPLCAPGETA